MFLIFFFFFSTSSPDSESEPPTTVVVPVPPPPSTRGTHFGWYRRRISRQTALGLLLPGTSLLPKRRVVDLHPERRRLGFVYTS